MAKEEILELTVSNARKAYKEGNKETKQLLEKLYPGKFSGKIIDRIKTFEDACDELGIDGDELLHKNPKTVEQKVANAWTKLRIISQALQEGWKPNYNSSNQCKWRPYFYWKNDADGFVFHSSRWYDQRSSAGIGVRFCFETEEKSTYFGQQFIDLHKVVLEN